MATIDVFIRSYKKDFDFLFKCLEHLHRHLSGYRNIIVAVPEDEVHLLSMLTAEKVIGWKPRHQNGYIDQQLCKMNCFLYTDADYVFIIDSDCIFTEDCNVDEYFKRGKPIIYFDHYDNVGEAKCWKESTERLTQMKVENEYMRRHPFVYKTDDLKIVFDYLTSIKSPIIFNQRGIVKMSEFNIIGALLHKNEITSEHYCFIDCGKKKMPFTKLTQLWSWGGIKEYHEKIKK